MLTIPIWWSVEEGSSIFVCDHRRWMSANSICFHEKAVMIRIVTLISQQIPLSITLSKQGLSDWHPLSQTTTTLHVYTILEWIFPKERIHLFFSNSSFLLQRKFIHFLCPFLTLQSKLLILRIIQFSNHQR